MNIFSSKCMINILIWQMVSCRMDELISSDHTRRFVKCDQVTKVMMFLLYTLSLNFVHNFTHITSKRATSDDTF